MEPLSKMKKPHLYIALYALDGALHENGRTGPQEYYWTFTVIPENAPKDQECIRYRIRKRPGWHKLNPDETGLEKTIWDNDRRFVPLGRHDGIVARVLIAEVDDAEAVEAHIQNAWPHATMHVKKFGVIRTSRDWVQRCLEGMEGLVPGSLGGNHCMPKSKSAPWKTIEGICTAFAKKAASEGAGGDAVPTFDLLENKEITR